MKRNYYVLLLALFCLLLVQCKKSGTGETALRIIVTDSTHGVVSGAAVKLFLNVADLYAETNQIGATQTTGADGRVVFHDLSAGNLYAYKVQTGCRDNLNLWNPPTEDHSLFAPLTAGEQKDLIVVISPSGGRLKLINNTNMQYRFSNSEIDIPPLDPHTTYIQYVNNGMYYFNSFPAGASSQNRDTVLMFYCGDTTRVNLPF